MPMREFQSNKCRQRFQLSLIQKEGGVSSSCCSTFLLSLLLKKCSSPSKTLTEWRYETKSYKIWRGGASAGCFFHAAFRLLVRSMAFTSCVVVYCTTCFCLLSSEKQIGALPFPHEALFPSSFLWHCCSPRSTYVNDACPCRSPCRPRRLAAWR